MNSDSATPPLLPARALRDLDAGCRIGFLVVTAVLAYVAMRLSWPFFSLQISRMFEAMVQGQPMPVTLRIAEAGKQIWMPLSALLATVAVTCGVAVRRPLTALLIIAGCNLALAGISILLGSAVLDGMGKVLNTLQ